MKAHGYEDNAGVLLGRGSEVAACPTRFLNRTDLHRQEHCFSRMTTRRVHRRGSVAWRIARRVTLATFTARARVSGEYRTSKEAGERVRLRPAPPTLQDGRAGRRAPAPTGDYRAFLFPNEQMRGEST